MKNMREYGDSVNEPSLVYQDSFWRALEQLIYEYEFIVDRPRGTTHPRYPDLIYPVDYGYLAGTKSMDGDGIDVWRGTGDSGIDAIVVTIDLLKKDSEIKILFNCLPEEKECILKLQNSGVMSAILIERGSVADCMK